MALVNIERLIIKTENDALLKVIDGKLDKLLGNPTVSVPGHFSAFSLYQGNQLLFIQKGKLNIMAITLKDTQKFTAVLKFKDSKGADTDAASVEVISSNTDACVVSYDDPTNTITGVAGLPGVAALSIIAKDEAGNVLAFEDTAIEVTAGSAVSGTLEAVEITEQ